MKERPIIFNAEMVRAILAGNKVQTRRVIKPQPVLGQPWKHGWIVDPVVMDIPIAYCPYGIRRDCLWVKETWADLRGFYGELAKVLYRADMSLEESALTCWKSSIFMPRWASRIMLEITDVRVERVQDISFKDTQAEGCTGRPLPGQLVSRNDAYQHFREFAHLWDSINSKRGLSWDSNPYVWAMTFRMIKP